jgi:hypothetical protein
MGNRVLAGVWVMAGLVLFGPASARAGTEFNFWAQEDAWVNEGNAGANYGNNSYLSVKDRSGLSEAFIKFSPDDLRPLIGQNILSASLWLYQYDYNYSPGDTVNARRAAADWNEAAITWNNKPGFSADIASTVNFIEGNDQWRQWSGLEGVVASWVTGGANYGLVLENNADMKSGELFSRFYSSEYADAGKRPYLQVQVSPHTAPEPVSMALFVAGGGIFTFARLRRRN